jgi:antitoxin PrlF
MKHSSTISSKGQVTVPQEIRTRVGLSAGDRVEFAVENGKILFRPLRSEANPFEKYRGALLAAGR